MKGAGKVWGGEYKCWERVGRSQCAIGFLKKGHKFVDMVGDEVQKVRNHGLHSKG